MDTPAVLPSPADILVSGALPDLSGTGGTVPGPAQQYAVIAVFFDSTGARVRVRELDSTLDAATTDAVVSGVVATVPRTVSQTSTRWGVLVKAAATQGGWDVLVDRMEYCACALLNRVMITRTLEELVRSRQVPGLHGTRQIVLDVKSDSTGAVVEKVLSRTSGSTQLDRFVYELADRMEIAPPLLNRRPLDAWSRLPIVLTFPSRRVTR